MSAAVAVDTSVVIAALLEWHEHHEPAARALSSSFLQARVLIPQAVLVESYSVMTRLPAPHRLRPADAWRLLDAAFSQRSIVGLSAPGTFALIRGLASSGIAGGLVYDAMILEAARRARASRFLTFNRRDFERLDRGVIEIVVPE